jgi:hypothetical protein
MMNLNDLFQALSNSHDADYEFRQSRFEAMTDEEKLEEIYSKILSYDVADLKQTLAAIYPSISSPR